MLTDSILRQVLHPYGLSLAHVSFISFSQNYVYRTLDRQRIIRISAGRYVRAEEIEAEFQWIGLLQAEGLPVCGGIPSSAGRYCERVEADGDVYFVSCIQQAPGEPIPRPETTMPPYAELGRLIGQLHSVAAKTHSQTATYARRPWHESRLLREDVAACSHRLAPGFAAGLDHLVQDLAKLPQSPARYGLIHGDIHFGNCYAENGRLWLFDFDNCEFGHFLQDIATMLYDAIYMRLLNRVGPQELIQQIDERFDLFLTGYRETGPLTQINGPDLHQFFLLREAVIAVHYHRILNFDTLTPPQLAGINEMQQNVIRRKHPAAGRWAISGE